MVDVQLSEIAKNYGQQRVVSGLNLDVKSGEYVVLLGPSGCGKTTTLKMIAGLERPDQGKISIGGLDVSSVPPRKRDVAIVFQHDAMYPHLTIRDSIVFGLKKLISAEEIRERINQACELTGVTDLLDRRPANLSGGELRRAAVAKAIVRRASVRLLDEPLSALDAHVRYGIQESLLRWHEATQGTTIHVTHDGQEAMRVADRIAVMDDGKILQFATPAEIYKCPASKSVALAIGSPPINIISAAVKDEQLCICEKKMTAQGTDVDASIGDSLEVGIRPESLRWLDKVEEATDSGIVINGRVDRIDQYSARHFARIGVGEVSIMADATDHSVTLGDQVILFAARADLHLFDAESGNRQPVNE